MKKRDISPLKIAGAYIGTVVGAGFATGQEILQFFASFRLSGFWGIIIATGFFIFFGLIIMELGFTLKAKSHLEIVNESCGELLGRAMDIIISVCLFISLTAMMAGTGALFGQLGLTAVLGNIIMAVLTVMTVLTGINGVINAISAVVPFLLTSVIAISIYSITNSPPDFSETVLIPGNGMIGNWFTAAVLYASYNIITSISVLGPLGSSAADKKTVKKGAVLGGLGLGIAALMIYLAISGNLSTSLRLEVPMSFLAGNISKAVQMLYTVVLIAEIYTTAVGSLYGFSSRLMSSERAPAKGGVVIIGAAIAALLASLLGFSNLVKYLYPLQGYGGIVLLAFLLFPKRKFGIKRIHIIR